MAKNKKRVWSYLHANVEGVRFFLAAVPLQEGLDLVPFKNAANKTLIFKTEDLAKECIIYTDEQVGRKEASHVVQSGYQPSPGIVCMKPATWELFQREQEGRWVYCESLDEYKEICKGLARQALLMQRPSDFN